jgi:hypothetical protein
MEYFRKPRYPETEELDYWIAALTKDLIEIGWAVAEEDECDDDEIGET